MNVVAVQSDIVWEDRQANHRHVAELLASVDIPPQSLIVLPEMFDTGFSMNSAATAQTLKRESEVFLMSLGAQHRSAVLAGVVGPLVDAQASNEAVAYSPAGEMLARYQKMQPFTPSGEDVHYGAGSRPAAFTWQGVRVAPFICYDLRFPEVFRPIADQVDLICVIASWPERRSEHWVRLLQARAIENQAYVIGVNRCGRDPQVSYDGRTVGFDPQGQSLFELGREEQVVQCDLDPQIVRAWREDFPALQDRRS